MCSVYYGVSLHYSCILFTMVRVSSSIVAIISMDSMDTLIGQPWTAGHPLLTSLSAILSPFWMTRQSDDWTAGHVTSFFGIQSAIQGSINRDAYRYGFRYMIQYSVSHFSVSALASSPTLGAKFLSHSVSVPVTRVGLTLRKDRDKTHKIL